MSKYIQKSLIFIFSLLLIITLFSSCSGNKNTDVSKTDNEKEFTGAVFEKNGNLYFYSEKSGIIKSIGDNSMSKSLTSLSPDKKKVLFQYYKTKDENLSPPLLGIYDINSGKSVTLTLNSQYSEQLMDASWVGNNVILAEGHVNPDVEGYVLYNAENGNEINYCGGELYQVLSDCKSMLFKLTPHVFPPIDSNITIMTPSGEMVELYSVKSPKDSIIDAKISDDLTKIAFWSSINNTNAYINIADYNFTDSKISNIKSYPIENLQGVLEFDGKAPIVKSNDGFIYRLDGEKFVKSEAVVINNEKSIDKDSQDKLYKACEKLFGKSFDPTIDTQNLHWF